MINPTEAEIRTAKRMAFVVRLLLPVVTVLKPLIMAVIYVGIVILYVPAGIVEMVWRWLENKFRC